MSLKRILLNKNLSKLIFDNQIRCYHFANMNPIKTLTLSKIGNLSLSRNVTTESTNQTEANPSSSVDLEEMRKFKSLSDSWWIENGEFEALHQMNVLRVPLIRDTMRSYRSSLPQTERDKILTYTDESNQNKLYTNDELAREPLLGLNILDIGCGGGILSQPLARLGAQVTGIDMCKENIISAQLRVESEIERSNGKNSKFYDRLRFINCTIEDLAVVDDNFNYFDAIVCSEVVEHVNNLNDFVTNSVKLLKNNGYAFYTTINRTTESYLLGIVAAEYVLNLVPKGTHTWDKFVKPDELRTILEQNETFVKFEMGLCYNPLTKNWSWSRNSGVNYAMYAQKYQTNLKSNSSSN